MRRTSRPLDEAQDVVAGRMRVGLHDLFELIHAINPTGRTGGRSGDVTRAYELKAKLQSLLIRAHRDELHVVAEADGTIAIQHRYSNRDGCHAQLDALDDDARAWIRLQLDTREDALDVPISGAGPRARKPASDPLARGREALEAYDFEAAIVLFREAMEEEGGLDATRALLEVLVDVLALDDEALALEETLDVDAHANEDVCRLLGLAAARVGQSERARGWLTGASGPRAGEAWMVLAQQALAAGKVEDAERALQEGARLDPAHADVVELRARIVGARTEARRPEEEALQVLAAEGDDDAVEARARALLARWPDSAIAGRIIAAIEVRRRTRAGEALRASAEHALEEGELARARDLAHRAGTYGVEVRGVLSRVDVAVREVRVSRDAAAVDEVCAALQTDERRGFVAYVALEPELRARVRARVEDATTLQWLDELVSGKLRSGDLEVVIVAVLAMREVRVAAGAGAYGEVLALLDGHPVLATLRDARVLRTRAHDQLAAARHRDGVAALDAAHAAWDANDAAAAARLLDGLELRALPAEQRERAERLATRVRERADIDARMQRIEACCAERDFLAARRELDAVRAIPAHTPEVVEAQLEAVRGALRDAWHVRTTTRSGFGPRQLGELIGEHRREIAPMPWVSSDGHLVMVAAYGKHLFVAAIDVVASSATVHYVHTPEPLGSDADRCVDGDRIWIGGERAALLLDWRTGDVLRWESLARFHEEGARREHLHFVPATRSMWIETYFHERQTWALRVIDLERWEIVRSVASGRYLVAIPGEVPRFAALDSNTGALLYSGRGNSTGEIVELRTQRIVAVVSHPGGDGLIVAAARLDDDAEVVLYDIAPGRAPRSIVLPGTNPDLTFWLQAVHGHGLVFAFAVTDSGTAERFVFEVRPDGLVQLDRAAAPHELVVVHDLASRACYALWGSDTGVHAAKLTELPAASTQHERFPTFAPYFFCKPADDALFEGLDEAMADGRWEDVRARLDGEDVDAISPPLREHYLHLRGLAYARLGDPARASAIWKQGLDYDRGSRILSCHLDLCLHAVEDLAAASGESEPLIVSVRRSIANAAALRARGDVAGALALLRAPCVYRARERQSLARLAETWLALPDVDDITAWFDKAQALSQFLAIVDDKQRDAPMPGAWDDRQIAAIASAAEAWFAHDEARRST